MGAKATWVSIDPPGERLAVATTDGRVLLFDLDAERVIETLHNEDHISRVLWTPDGQHLLVAEYGGRLRIFDGDGGHVEDLDTGHKSLTDLDYHEDGHHFVTGGGEGRFRVWHFASRSLAWENDTHSPCNAVSFAGDQIVAGCEDGYFRVYGGPGEEGGLFSGRVISLGVTSIAVRPGENAVVFGGTKGGIVVTSTDAEQRWPNVVNLIRVPPKPISVNAVAWSRDGSVYAAACSDDTVRAFSWPGQPDFSAPLGRPFYARSPKPPWSQDFIISGVCFHPDPSRLFACSFTGEVVEWQYEVSPDRRLVRPKRRVLFTVPEHAAPENTAPADGLPEDAAAEATRRLADIRAATTEKLD